MIRKPAYRMALQGPVLLRTKLNESPCLLPRTFSDGTRVAVMLGQFYSDQLDAAEKHYGRQLLAGEQKLLVAYLRDHPHGPSTA